MVLASSEFCVEHFVQNMFPVMVTPECITGGPVHGIFNPLAYRAQEQFLLLIKHIGRVDTLMAAVYAIYR